MSMSKAQRLRDLAIAFAGDVDATLAALREAPERIRLAEHAVADAEARLREHKQGAVVGAQQIVDAERLTLTLSAPEDVYNGKNEAIRKAALDRHIHEHGENLRVAEAELASVQWITGDLEYAVDTARIEAKSAANAFAALRHTAAIQTALLQVYLSQTGDDYDATF